MNNKQTEIISLTKNELPQLAAIIGLSAPKGTDIQTLALQELEYLKMIGLSNPVIYECIPETIVAAIKTTLKQNLTLDPYANLVYVKTRNVNLGTKDSPQWSKALEIQPSANGLISIARQAGRVLDVERPEIIKNQEGKVTGVKIRFLVPSYDERGRRCARWREVEFDETDFARWRRASHNENSRGKNDAGQKDYSNANYSNWKGGPDPEFIRAKAIRHGLKKLGTNLNERSANIPAASSVNVDIDQEKDEAAMNDEYINHEDVHDYKNEGTTNATNFPGTAGNGVHVTMHDEIDIPDSSNL